MTISHDATKVLAKVQDIRTDDARLYDNFQKSYSERELDKASELIWGSVSKIANAVGLIHGKKLGKHKVLVQFMREIARIRNNQKAIEWIDVAESLHSNFYHNWMEEETFEENVRKVVALRFWLIQVLDSEIEKITKANSE